MKHDSDPPPEQPELTIHVTKLGERIAHLNDRLGDIVDTQTTLRNLFYGLFFTGVLTVVVTSIAVGRYLETVDTLRRDVDRLQEQASMRGPSHVSTARE